MKRMVIIVMRMRRMIMMMRQARWDLFSLADVNNNDHYDDKDD